jgi:hypothetical protein
LPKAKREQKRKSMALDDDLVAPLPKKPKTPRIVKAPVPKASYSGLRSSIKSGLNVSSTRESGGA